MTLLINTFHNTQYVTRKTPEEVERIANTPPHHWTPTEKAFVRRVRSALCGIKGCTCGDDLGRRE